MDRLPFDVDALRQWAEWYEHPPTDPDELRRVWQQLIADVLASADELELLQHEARRVLS